MHGILHLAKCAECSIQRRETHRYPALLLSRLPPAFLAARRKTLHIYILALPV
jgi:hypothetical protein